MKRYWVPAFAGMAIFATLASAQQAADFRWEAPVSVSGHDALNRLTLPFAAYRDARPDWSDLRLFNAKGESLAIAFAGEMEPVRTEPAPVPLPIFPVSAAEAAREAAMQSLNVVVKNDASGTIVSVQGRAANKPAPARAAAWIVDASSFKTPIRALVLTWDVHAGTEVVKVEVQASDDLKSWRYAIARVPLMRLEQNGQVLEQRRVDLNGLRAKYLRITGEPAAFKLTGVSALSAEVVTPAPRSKHVVLGTPGTKPGEYLFDLGARLPVEMARIIVPSNSVAPFSLATRESDKTPWRTFASGTFYNLARDGAILEAPAVAVGRSPMRYVMAQLDPRSPALSEAPHLEVEWRPAQLVFVARGDGPYHLEFGNRDAKGAILAVSQLIPAYETQAEMKLPEARVGEVHPNAPPESALRAAIGDTSPRKVVLWAILVVAVIALAAMAWKLSRQR
jgi:uncharacterized protein DUF3999